MRVSFRASLPEPEVAFDRLQLSANVWILSRTLALSYGHSSSCVMNQCRRIVPVYHYMMAYRMLPYINHPFRGDLMITNLHYLTCTDVKHARGVVRMMKKIRGAFYGSIAGDFCCSLLPHVIKQYAGGRFLPIHRPRLLKSWMRQPYIGVVQSYNPVENAPFDTAHLYGRADGWMVSGLFVRDTSTGELLYCSTTGWTYDGKRRKSSILIVMDVAKSAAIIYFCGEPLFQRIDMFRGTIIYTIR